MIRGDWQGGRFLAPLDRGVEGKDKGEDPLLSSPLVRGVGGFRGLTVHRECLSNSEIYHNVPLGDF